MALGLVMSIGRQVTGKIPTGKVNITYCYHHYYYYLLLFYLLVVNGREEGEVAQHLPTEPL